MGQHALAHSVVEKTAGAAFNTVPSGMLRREDPGEQERWSQWRAVSDTLSDSAAPEQMRREQPDSSEHSQATIHKTKEGQRKSQSTVSSALEVAAEGHAAQQEEKDAFASWRARRGHLVPGIYTGNSSAAGASLAEIGNALGGSVLESATNRKTKMFSISYQTKVVGSFGLLQQHYCRDRQAEGSGPRDESVVCDQTAVGPDETFHIFHWSNIPWLHVLQGGRNFMFCRDAREFITCNQEEITPSEEFLMQTLKDRKVFKGTAGHEDGQWCAVDIKTDRLQCNNPDLKSGWHATFMVEELPSTTN